jgi:hypothetical protein
MKTLFFILILFPLISVSQDSIVWNFKWETEILQNPVWNIDSFENLIVSEKDNLKKYDSLGVKKFTQSNKLFGTISLIDPSNLMKILLFSEQQQLISYIDNTLSQQQENIDLSNFDLSYVTLVSTSGQADKFWVYDQDNSKILFIAKNTLQRQKIENLVGLLGCQDIIQLFEQNNYLYLIDKKKGIYQFDIYGSLTDYWENTGIIWTVIEGDNAFLLKNKNLQVLNLKNHTLENFNLPKEDIQQFRKWRNDFYFGSKNQIQKYSLEFLN